MLDLDGVLESGRYRILNAASLDAVNIIRHQPAEEPIICTWNVHNSCTDKWLVERATEGYYIRNEASNFYISVAAQPKDGGRVIGSKSPTEWAISRNGSSLRISPLVEPLLQIKVNRNAKHEGKELLLHKIPVEMNDSKSNDRSTPNGRYSEWSFVQDHDDEPPSYNGGGVHMGPIPPGLYWLGQAEILVTTGEQAAKNPTVGALTVASRSLGQANSTSPLHLSAISGDEPWHHQIWAIELGKRGYRLRNIGANAHLSLINREAVAELSTPGSSYCEWSISMIPKRNPTDIESFTISPVTDLNSSLATHFQSLFYKVQVKQIQWWHAFWHIEWRINAIRPEALKPLDLEL